MAPGEPWHRWVDPSQEPKRLQVDQRPVCAWLRNALKHPLFQNWRMGCGGSVVRSPDVVGYAFQDDLTMPIMELFDGATGKMARPHASVIAADRPNRLVFVTRTGTNEDGQGGTRV